MALLGVSAHLYSWASITRPEAPSRSGLSRNTAAARVLVRRTWGAALGGAVRGRSRQNCHKYRVNSIPQGSYENECPHTNRRLPLKKTRSSLV